MLEIGTKVRFPVAAGPFKKCGTFEEEGTVVGYERGFYLVETKATWKVPALTYNVLPETIKVEIP